MNRRRLLGDGTILLSAGLSGCLNSFSTTEGDDTDTETTRTTESTSTAQNGHEAFLIANEHATTHEVSVTVSRETAERETLVDSTYEIPSKYILDVPIKLEHGTAYHFEAVLAQGPKEEKTLTPDGCGDDSYNPDGDRPVVVWVSDAKPTILFQECDVLLPPEYTRESADQYEVS